MAGLDEASELARRQRLRLASLIAVLYAVTGFLAILLAIPPGYATAIFPPAGIAVAGLLAWGYRLWPGVLMGSFAANAAIRLWLEYQLSPELAAIAAAIGIGATLQALVAVWLVRRTGAWPGYLDDERSIARFMLLAGPVACTINPTLSVTLLYLTGEIGAAAYAFSWFTWWVGDTIGVFIGAPVVLAFIAAPRRVWRPRARTVAAPMLALSAILVLLFTHLSNWEEERARQRFHDLGSLVVERLRSQLDDYGLKLQSIDSFFQASSRVQREEFRRFVTGTLERYPAIRALEWLPVIRGDYRAAFEAFTRAEGFPEFQILERREGQLISAEPRDWYAPVLYLEPFEPNRGVLGFDVASQDDRLAALQRAADRGVPTATAAIRLVQDSGNHPGVLLAQPVYRKGHSADSTAPVVQRVSGFALGVFRLDEIINEALAIEGRDRFHLQLTDATNGTANQLVDTRPSKPLPVQADALALRAEADFGGRTYAVTVYPTRVYLRGVGGLQSWSMLVGGLVLVGLLGTLLLLVTGRAERVRELVRTRTEELSAVLNRAVEAILTLAPDGRILTANPAAEHLFGLSAGRLQERELQSFIAQRDRPALNALLAEDADREQAMRREILTAQVVPASGHYRPVEYSISEIDLGDRHFFTAVFHDISEREKIDRMKRELISVISHELRTPLTSIRGSLGLLRGGATGALPEPAHDLLRIADNNAERLVRLINDILDVERLALGKMEFHLGRHDAASLVAHALESNAGYAERLGVELRMRHAPSKQTPIEVDPDRFEQIMANLLSNAAKFSPSGEVVDVDVIDEAESVTVSVQDRGPGIPESFHERIFDQFAQSDSTDSRRKDGTGLGLNIVKLITEKMDGRVWFETEVGVGTTFFVRFPLARSTATAEA